MQLGQLPRRAGSVHPSLSPELEDAAAGTATFARGSANGITLRRGSTGTGNSVRQDNVSGASLSFLVSSTHQGHGTPTATTAAHALEADQPVHAVQSGAHESLAPGARSPSVSSTELPSPGRHEGEEQHEPGGLDGTSCASPSEQRPTGGLHLRIEPSYVASSAECAVQEAGEQNWRSGPWVAAVPGGPRVTGSPTAAAAPVSGEQPWLASVSPSGPWAASASSRVRTGPVAGPAATPVGRLKSRLRMSVNHLESSQTEAVPQRTKSVDIVPPLAALSAARVSGVTELAAPCSLDQERVPRSGQSAFAAGTGGSTWATSAVLPDSATGTASGSTGRTPGAGSAAAGFVSRGALRTRRAGTGHGLVPASSLVLSEHAVAEAASVCSSLTVRQTQSDLEDELIEQVHNRHDMRTAGRPTGEGHGRSSGPGVDVPGRGMSAAAAAAAAAGGLAGAAVATPPGTGAGAIAHAPIRLSHQPGHNRRLPNRHASMPAMKDGAVLRTTGLQRGSPDGRSALAGSMVPEDGEYPEGAQSRRNPSGPIVRAVDAANGPYLAAPSYCRAPSDSPLTSHMSIASSGAVPSTAQTRRALQIGASQGPLSAFAGMEGPMLRADSSPPCNGDAGGGGPISGLGLSHARVAGGGRTGFPADREGERDKCSFESEGRVLVSQLESAASPQPGVPSSILASQGHLSALEEAIAGDRPSHMSGRLMSSAHTYMSGAHAQHSSGLAALHAAVKQMMLQDSGLYTRVQASMKGISSLAKETTKLEFVRDASGATVINQYVVVKTLGRGSFGKVKLCLNTLDGRLYAVKMINRAHLLRQLQKPARPLRRRAPPPRNTSDTGIMSTGLTRNATEGNLTLNTSAAQSATPARASMDDTSPLTAIMREIAVMKKVDHPHVVRLHEVIDPPGSAYLMMVMEYCEGGCVMETRQQTGLTPLAEDTAREFFRQACLGLDYLHYNAVVHGDLKPENMLVGGDGRLKIADFGSSRFMGGDPTDATKTSCTPAFQSPEEIGRMPVDPYAADLWALACCLFCFCFGRLPFVGSCVVDIYRAILTRPHAYPVPDGGGGGAPAPSPALRDLLDRMLDKDPRKRLSLRAVMQHEWVTAGDTLPPLSSLRAMADAPQMIHVTHAEQVNAIDRSSLVSLIRARLKEKTCQPGEYLFKEGEEAHCVFMVMTGVVEMTQHLRRPAAMAHAFGAGRGSVGAEAPHGLGPGGGLEALGPGADDASFSVDLDESLTLDHGEGLQLTEAMNIVDGKLHIDRMQAVELRRRMHGSLALAENAEYVMEVKGPGTVIGEISLDNSAAAVHRMSARARGPVTVVKLTEENFFKALLALYGGAGHGGGSAASTTLTASSVSEALAKAGGAAGGGGGAAAGLAAAANTGPGAGAGAAGAGGPGSSGGGGSHAAPGPGPGLSAQHLMVLQYLEDSGSCAVFPPPPGQGPPGAGPGRMSMDASVGSLSSHGGRLAPGSLRFGHQSLGRGPGGLRMAAQPDMAAASSSAAAAEAAFAASASGAAGSRSSGGGSPLTLVPMMGMKQSGAHSHLGVLNTIHSLNASRAGAMNSSEGVADL